MDDFADALDSYNYNFQRGQVIKGKVTQQTTEGVFVEIGGKSPGFVPAQEAGINRRIPHTEALALEEEYEFLIIREQNDDGQVTLSRRQLEITEIWAELVEMAEAGKSIEMRISGTNRGGVTGEVRGLRGFIPRSHLVQRDNLDSLIGQLLTVNFLEIDPDNRKLVMSQRQAVQAEIMKDITVGTLQKGKVSSIKPYGAFIEFEGVTGLLHISQVSEKSVPALENVFQVGQDIKVMILNIDEAKNRMSLSTKLLENYPGEILENPTELMDTAEARVEKARQKMEA